MSPIMLLEGHQGDIFSVEFHPEGQYLASTGFDRQICKFSNFNNNKNNEKKTITINQCKQKLKEKNIFSVLWNVYGECENIGVMSGHSGAVMELHFSPDGNNLYTASTDTTLGLWDIIAGTRIKKLKGHTCFVNSVSGARRGPTLLCSGSDDSTIRVWDTRSRHQVHTLNNTYQVTAVTFNDTAEQVISGGIDNDIKVWDLRKNTVLYKLKGHTDTITGLSLSPDGSYVLSNSMDNNLRIWDVRPFAPYERCVKILSGHQHNFEKVKLYVKLHKKCFQFCFVKT